MKVPGSCTQLLLVTKSGERFPDFVLSQSLKLTIREDQHVFRHGIAAWHPDVLLLDAKLPEGIWRDLLRVANVPAIIVGSAHLDEYVIPCIVAGAKGHLSDDGIPRDVEEAAETVLNGDIYVGPKLASRLFSYLASISVSGHAPPPGGSVAADLSGAETRVLDLVARGLSNQGIADSLGVSRHTVANHVHSLLKKLNAKRRWDAVARAGLGG